MGTGLITGSDHSTSSMLAWVLIDSSVKAAVLLAIALVSTWALRRASAAIRDRIWSLAFCGAMVMPVISSVVPQWRLPVVGISPLAVTTSPSGTTDQTATQADRETPVNLHRVDTAVESLMEPESALQSRADDSVVGPRGLEPWQSEPRAVSAFANVSSALATIAEHSGTLLALWLAGLVILTAPFITAVTAAWKLRSRGQPFTDPAAKQLLDQTTTRLGLTHQVTFLQLDEKTIPMVIGVLRPVVVIPSNWQTWPVERFRCVMLHELAHVKRRDVLFQTIARLACALYWFNPLAWYALYRMRIDCELACDDQVLAMGEPASAYAGELIQIARMYRPARCAGGITMARSSRLETRVVSLLDAKRPHAPVSQKAGRFLLTLAAGLVFVLATMTMQRPTAVAVEQAEPPKERVQESAATAPTATTEPSEGLAHLHGGKGLLADKEGGIFFVAANNAVRNEIGIDKATAVKVQGLIEQYCQELTAARNGEFEAARQLEELKDLSQEDRQKRRKEARAKREADSKTVDEKFLSQLKAAFTADQLERLRQIARQAYGSQALILDKALATALELTPDQIKRIDSINRDYGQKEFTLLRPGALFTRYLELVKERNGKANELLTKEQQEKLTQLKGKPFDLARLISQGPRRTFGWFGAGAGIVMIVGIEAVQKDLGLSEDAAKKMSAIAKEFFVARRGAGAWRGVRVRLADGSTHAFYEPESPDWDFGEWNAVLAKFLPQLREALTADQFARLKQIHWQALGTAAYWDANVIQTLGISKEQQAQIAAIDDDYSARKLALFSPEAGRSDDLREKMIGLIQEHDAKIDASLTNAQRNQFATMKGNPFDLDQLRALDLAGPRPGPGGGGVRVGNDTFGDGIFSVVNNEAVQKELGLSRDVTTRILAVRDQFDTAWHEAGGGIRVRLIRRSSGSMYNFTEAAMPPWGILPIPGQSAESRAQEIAKMTELWHTTTAKFLPQLKEALTAEQYARLQQITWQALGTAAYLEPEVIQALGISKEQQDAISAPMNEYRQKREAFLRQGGGGPDGGDLREKINELKQDQDTKIRESLKKDQLEKFSMMKGKEFDVNQLRDVDRSGMLGGRPPTGPPPKGE